MRPLSKSPRGHATQAVLALVSSVALSASSISAILAQEVGEDEPTDQSGEIGEATEPSGGSNEAGAQFDQVTLVDRMPLPDGIANSGNRGMVVWAEGRVGYFPVDEAKGLAAVDLTTLQEVARQEVAGPGQAIYGAGNSSSQHQFAIDDASGTLYVPIQDDGIASGSDNLVCAQSLLVTDACLGEIRVIDGVTLEVLASHRFRPITIDGVATLPVLRAMSYSPATDGTTAKLHLFVEAQFTPGFSDADARTRANFAYAVQMDAATGQTDWVTRLSGCTDFHQSASVANAGRRNAIFHVADDEAPRLYVGCYRSRGATAIVKVELNGSDPLMAPVGQQAFNGLPEAAGYLPDPQGERMLVKVTGGSGASYLVFDGQREAFVGNIGVGAFPARALVGALDEDAGRLFVLALSSDLDNKTQGLFVADSRRDPVAQAIVLDRFASVFAGHRDGGQIANSTPIAVVPAREEHPRRIFLRPGGTGAIGGAGDFYYVLEDRGEVPEVGAEPFRVIAPDSDDVPVAAPRTAVNLNATARGYGLRVLLLGGLEALASTDPTRTLKTAATRQDTGAAADSFAAVVPGLLNIIDTFARIAGQETGLAEAFREAYPGFEGTGTSLGLNCFTADREIGFGLAASRAIPSDLTTTGASASAAPAFADPQTLQDFADPAARCAGEGLEVADELAGLVGAQIPSQVGTAIPFASDQASCVSDEGETTDSVGGDFVAGRAVAHVRCVAGSTSEGLGQSQFISVADVAVGDVFSTFKIEHVDDRVVATIRSVARDINIAGLVQIDEVSAEAVSWANGRLSPDDVARATCDPSQTAGTCLRRTVRGVTAGDFSCDVCPSNEQLVSAMSAALGGQWAVRLREPEQQLAFGFENGALAAIQKPFDELFADSILNADGLITVPALEVVRVNDDQVGRARQVYQFAGVELASMFTIQCQLHIIDGECRREPGALTIALQDMAEVPLSGGVFELYADADAGDGSGDGIIDPLTDVLIDQGTCTTAADGVGTCRFEDLEPGDYVIREAAAPVGYIAANDFGLTVGEGADLTVTFTNAPSIGAIDIALVDEFGTALEGATFQLYIDNGDGVLAEPSLVGSSASADQFVTSCVTDFFGQCGFEQIPLGPTGERSFIVHESSPPLDHAPSPDAALTLKSGELFTLNFVNVKDLGGRILISLVDDVTGEPLAGGSFDVLVDDGNQTVDDTDVLYASCTTDASGGCLFAGLAPGAESVTGPLRIEEAGFALSVPVDAYVVRQSGAPEGYQPADAVGFAFTERGQQADVGFRNGLDVPEAEPSDEPTVTTTQPATTDDTTGEGDGTGDSGAMVDDSGSGSDDGFGSTQETTPSSSEPVTTGTFTPFPTMTGPIAFEIPVPTPVVARTSAPQPAVAPIVQLLQAPARLARLVAREPLQAAAFGGLILLGAGSAAVARRRLLLVELLA